MGHGWDWRRGVLLPVASRSFIRRQRLRCRHGEPPDPEVLAGAVEADAVASYLNKRDQKQDQIGKRKAQIFVIWVFRV